MPILWNGGRSDWRTAIAATRAEHGGECKNLTAIVTKSTGRACDRWALALTRVRPLGVPCFTPPLRLTSSQVTTLVVLGLALLQLAAAGAPSDRLELRWSAPDGCPTEEQVRTDVHSLLANQPLTAEERVVATGSIEQKPDASYSLRLTANGQSRNIDGANCQQLAQAAALLLALLVDPSRATSLSEAANATPSDQQTQPAPSGAPSSEQREPGWPVAPTSTTPPQAKSRDSRSAKPTETSILAEAGARLDIGSWPATEPAALLGFGLAKDWWQALVHGTVGKTVYLPAKSGGELKLFVADFDLTLMYRARFGQWAFEPGVGLDLGLVQATSQEFEPGSRSALSLSVVGAMRASWRPGSVPGLWAEVGAGFPVIRPHWVVNDGEQLHRFGPFLRSQAGIQAAF